MFLRIEKGSAVPISRQIADQIATLCASGGVEPGERMPSVRELAVNQNTVLRVYERLCGEGLLEMRHGQGTFVTSRMSKTRMATHRARLVDELRQIVRQATGLGLSTDELHELLAEAANGVERSTAVATIEELKS